VKTKLTRAEPKISQYFENLGRRVYSRAELAATFQKERYGPWDLAWHTAFPEFLAFLIERNHLRLVELQSPRYGQKLERYCLGEPTPFELALSIRKSGYLSHGTAAFLHGLTQKQLPTIYVNIEQSAKPANERRQLLRLA